MSGSAGSILVDLILNDAQFKQGLTSNSSSIKKSTKEWSAAFDQVTGSFNELLAAIGVSLSIAGIYELTKGSLDAATAVDELGKRLGLTTDQVQEYQFAAKAAGIDSETFATGMAHLNAQIASGKLPYKNTSDAIQTLADKVQNAQNATTRAAIVNDAFGDKLGNKFIPLLLSGANGLQQMADQAKQLGVVIDTGTIKAAEEFNVTLGTIATTIKSNFQEGLLSAFLGDSDHLKDTFSDPKFIEGVKNIGQAFGELAKNILDLVNYIGQHESEFELLAKIAAAGYAGGKIAGVPGALIAMGGVAGPSIDKAKGNDSIKAWEQEQFAKIDAYLGTGPGTVTPNITMPANVLTDPDAIAKLKAANAQLLANGASTGHVNNQPGNYTTVAQRAQRDADTKSIQAWVAVQKDAIVTLAQESSYIGLTTVDIDKLKDARAIEKSATVESNKLHGDAKAAFEKETDAIIAARAAIIQYNYDVSRLASTGAANFFTKYAEDATDAAKQIQTVLQDAFSGAEDALLKFVQTGKLSFHDLATSIITDLLKIQIKNTLAGVAGLGSAALGGSGGSLLNSAFGALTGGSGGLLSSLGLGQGAAAHVAQLGAGVQGPLQESAGGIWADFAGLFADGGYIPPGQWGIAGEAGAERIYGGKTGVSVQTNQGNGGGDTYIDARGADQGAVMRIASLTTKLAGPGKTEQRVTDAQKRGKVKR